MLCCHRLTGSWLRQDAFVRQGTGRHMNLLMQLLSLLLSLSSISWEGPLVPRVSRRLIDVLWHLGLPGGWMNGALWTNQVEMLPIAQKLWHQSKRLLAEASTKAMNNGSTLPMLLLMRDKTTESDEWLTQHGDVIEWKHFPRYCPFVRGIHRSPVNSPHKGQWRGALVFSLICAWINRWVNNGEAGDLRLHRAHCDVIVMMRPNCAIWRHRTCSKSDHAVDC